jgi:hypothetical protein
LGAVFFYSHLAFSWEMFAWLFLVPDIAFIAYLHSTQLGAFAYNLTHSYVGAVLLLIIGIYFNNLTAQAISIIWFFHIGFDRAIGYGLKYFTGFHDTHLGVVGKKKTQD